MITADILNGIRRVSNGLFLFRQRQALSVQQSLNFYPQVMPVPPNMHPNLPSGGRTNVSTNAATYWASLPKLELPETNLTPHYLEDFVAHPPMEAA